MSQWNVLHLRLKRTMILQSRPERQNRPSTLPGATATRLSSCWLSNGNATAVPSYFLCIKLSTHLPYAMCYLILVCPARDMRRKFSSQIMSAPVKIVDKLCHHYKAPYENRQIIGESQGVAL
jgi:hypothetical protein